MIPQYNSYMEIVAYFGNTQIYIFRNKKKKKETLIYKSYLRQQKLLGMGLIIISIIGCIVIPEDCGGCLIAGLMGIARVVYD